MNAIPTLCFVLLCGATIAHGKLYKRSLQERSLSEFLYITNNTDAQELQCMLDNVPECQKKLYLRDLIDELKEIGSFMKKMKEIDWTDDNLDLMKVLEYDEFELLAKIEHLNHQLPATWDDSTQTYQAFGHIVDQCVQEIAQLDLSSSQTFDEARMKVLRQIITCEERGFNLAVNRMGQIDVNDVQSIYKEVKVIKEIMAEVRDINYVAVGVMFIDGSDYPQPESWNDALKNDAISPANIKKAINELYSRFGPDDKDATGGMSGVKRASQRLVEKMVNARNVNIAAKKNDLKRRIAALLKNLGK